jgi:hypothetical protein
MAKNKFGIPEIELSKIRARDKRCVYCRKAMVYPYLGENCADRATIEHLNCDGPFYCNKGLEVRDIVICCGSCNSSRGRKELVEWFKTPYCIERNISARTVAAPVRSYLRRQIKSGPGRHRRPRDNANHRVVLKWGEDPGD